MTVIVPMPPKFDPDIPTLPDWVPPIDTGQPSAEDLNEISDIPRANFAARNSAIPIPYGRGRFFGQPFVITVDETRSSLIVAYGLGEGEIQGYESIIVDGDDIIANGTAYFGLKERGFESGTFAANIWTGENSIDGTNPRTGQFSATVLCAAGGPNLLSDYTIAPAEGTVMRITGYMARDELSLPDADATIAIRWYDASFAAVGGRDGGTAIQGELGLADDAVSGYQKVVRTCTVPAGAVYYRFDFGESGGTTGRWYCDDAQTEVLQIDNPDLSSDAIELVLYRGEANQPVESLINSALGTYEDNNNGLAYVTARFPSGSTSGFPRLEMIYQGRKVYDPRKDDTAALRGPEMTFARASAAWFKDWEGIYRSAAAGVPRFDGMRKVENLLLGSADMIGTDPAWTDSGSPDSTEGLYLDPWGYGTEGVWTLTDNDTGGFEAVAQTITVPDDKATYVFSIYIRKTTADDKTIPAINTGLSGGTATNSNPRLDTETGATSGGFNTTVTDEGNYWRMSWTITNNGTGNTSLTFNVFPNARATIGGVDDATVTGTTTFYGGQIENRSNAIDLRPGEYQATTTAAVARYYNTNLDGTLLRGERTVENVVLHSQFLTNAAWNKTRCVATENTSIAPDGTLTADTLTDNGAGGSNTAFVQQTNVNSGLGRTIVSVYAQPDQSDQLLMENSAFGSNGLSYFDLRNGTVVSEAANHTATIEAADFGWYRCSIAFDDPTDGNGSIIFALAENGSSSITLNGENSIRLWGAQVENVGEYQWQTIPSEHIATGTTPDSYVTTTDVYGVDIPGGRGLMIEDERTNIMDDSCDVTTGNWTRGGGPTYSEAENGLFEGFTGIKFVNDNATASRSFSQTHGTFVDNQADTVSVIIENVDATLTHVSIYDQTQTAFVYRIAYNWDTDVVTVVNNPNSEGSYIVEQLGTGPNGGKMVRLSVTAIGTTSGTGGAGNSRRYICYPAGISVNGDTVYVYHNQFEVNVPWQHHSSPIVTTGTTDVTRNRDDLNANGNLGTDFNASAGTMVAKGRRLVPSANLNQGNIMSFHDDTAAERISLYVSGAETSGFFVADGGATQALITIDQHAELGNEHIQAARFAVNDFQQYVNGEAGTADTVGTLPTVTDLRIGGVQLATTENWWGYVAEARYYNMAMDDEFLDGVSRGAYKDNQPYYPDALTMNYNFARDMSLYGPSTLSGEGTHRADDSATWEYSTNPALCFLDMINNFSGWSVENTGIKALADYNDLPIEGTNVNRRSFGLNLTRPQTVERWTRGFRTYMGAFIGWEGGKIRVIPNRPDVEAPGGLSSDGTASTALTIDIDNTEQADVGAGNFTVEVTAQLNDTSAATKSLLWKKSGVTDATAGWSIFSTSANDIRCRIADGTNSVLIDAVGDYQDNVFHHIVLRVNRDNDTAELIIDGVNDPAGTTSIAAVTGSLSNTIDIRAMLDHEGVVDEIRIWDRLRTDEELAEYRLREIDNAAEEPNLIGYWKLNEGSGTEVFDSSGAGLRGTIGASGTLTTGNLEIVPANVAMVITADDIIKDSMNVRRRSLRNTPNSVAVDYLDATSARWRQERVQADSTRVTSGDELRRLSRVSLPGIQNASQAQREATERLNWYLTDLEATFSLFDEGWKLQTGSIVSVTHPIGLSNKLMRITRVTGESGRWTVDATEYDPAVYSDEVVTDPTLPDTNLGSPLSPPQVSNLQTAEELYVTTEGNTGSRVRITFDEPGYPFLSQYLVQGYVGTTKVFETSTQSSDVVTPGVETLVAVDNPTGITYEVRVSVQSPFATGTPVVDTVNVLGKQLPPSDVPNISAVITAADTVELNWQAATDIDIWRYEIRRGSTIDTWATATDITETLLIDGLSTTRTGIPVGTYRFFVKARDSVGNESNNAATVDVTFSVPPAATNLTGFEVASEVRLAWQAPSTGFTERYRIAYDTIPTGNEITLDIVDTLRFQTKDVPEGTWRFLVYSQDKNGVEAASAATIDVEVTSDADAFLADSYSFEQRTTTDDPVRVETNGSTTNMHEYELRLDAENARIWVTNMADVFLSSPSDFSTYSAEPLANYHSSGSSEWLSETVDFGLLLTGSWNLTTSGVSALNAPISTVLELSTDNVTFTTFGNAAKGDYRYARVRVTTLTTATALIETPGVELKINVVPIEESGAGTTSATIGKTINLEREYSALKEVNAQPKLNTDSLMAIVDNIVTGVNTAVQGDGVDSISMGDVLDQGTGSFTIEFRARRKTGSTANDANMIAKRDATAGYVMRADQTTDEVQMVLVAPSSTTVNITTTGDVFPDDGDFHHFAWVVDRGTDVMRLYVDDVEVAGSPWSIFTAETGNLDNAGALVFFDHSTEATGVAFDGELDEIRFWGDVRTPTEISDNKDITLDMTQTQAGLEGYWLMDGTVGADVPTSGGGLPDVSGNNYDGNATGAGLTYTDPGTDSNNPLQKINSFDVYIFDIFGQQLVEQFQWNWKGV